MRDRSATFRRLLLRLLGGLVGSLVGVVAGIAVAGAFVAYQTLTETERNPGAGAFSVIAVIFTVPCGLVMGAWYGSRTAGWLHDRRTARRGGEPFAPRRRD